MKEITLNILVVNKIDYAKLAFVNVNSLQRFNPDQKFRIFCDKSNYDFIMEHSGKFLNPDTVEVLHSWNEATDNWQKLKLDIIESYLHKEDACIVDSDSIFTCPLEDFPNDKILFLNANNSQLTYTDQDRWFLKDYIPQLNEGTISYQIGIFNYPLGLHSQEFIDDCKKTCDIIWNLPDGTHQDSNILSGTRRQCEQIALSVHSQEKYKDKIITFKREDRLNHKEKMESLYWSCRGEGSEAGQHKFLLKQYGW